MKKQKYRLQKDFTLLTFSLFIIIAVWISFSIYHTHVTSTISDVLQIRIEPIVGTFDTTTINKLKTRTAIEPDFASPLGTESAETNKPLPTETPTPEEPANDDVDISLEDETGVTLEPELEEVAQ